MGDTWHTNIKLQSFEVLGDHKESYAALPQITFSQMDAYDFYGIDLTLDGELSYFTNDKAIIDEASRLHIEPKASFGYQEYAWSFLSEFSLLHTEYNQHISTGTDFDERGHVLCLKYGVQPVKLRARNCLFL